MCCFSVASPVGWIERLFPPRVHVSKTNIFARMIAPGVQGLAYQMNLKAAREIAMVLPLPVVPGSGEDAVTFVDLHEHSKMFDDLAALFHVLQPLARKGGASRSLSLAPKLVVHKVGSFIASYVPTRADFVRLDPRFRMPEVLFDAVPAYADHGFAVFQLEPGDLTVHPMAMTFPTRAPHRLFFPTVHVHDGSFHAIAKFDHALYYQRETAALEDLVSPMKPRKDYAGLVDPASPVIRRSLHGRIPNEDQWI
jgi:hypothetical protein